LYVESRLLKKVYYSRSLSLSKGVEERYTFYPMSSSVSYLKLSLYALKHVKRLNF